MGNPEESERLPLLHADREAGGRRRSSMSITLICLIIFAVGCVAVTTAISLSFAESGKSSNTTTTTPGMLLWTFLSYCTTFSQPPNSYWGRLYLCPLTDGLGQPGLVRSGWQGAEDGGYWRPHCWGLWPWRISSQWCKSIVNLDESPCGIFYFSCGWEQTMLQSENWFQKVRGRTQP